MGEPGRRAGGRAAAERATLEAVETAESDTAATTQDRAA
jgi:hypothetical protein